MGRYDEQTHLQLRYVHAIAYMQTIRCRASCACAAAMKDFPHVCVCVCGETGFTLYLPIAPGYPHSSPSLPPWHAYHLTLTAPSCVTLLRFADTGMRDTGAISYSYRGTFLPARAFASKLVLARIPPLDSLCVSSRPSRRGKRRENRADGEERRYASFVGASE